MPALHTITTPSRMALIAIVLAFALTAGLLLRAPGAPVLNGGTSSGGDAAWTPAAASVSAGEHYEPHQLIIGLRGATTPAAAVAYINAHTALHVAIAPHSSGDPHAALVRLPTNVTVGEARAALRTQAPVAYAVPNYIARAAGRFIPNDTGKGHVAGGWQKLQWNYDPRAGVNAPGAWANLIADGEPGASGVTVAVVDSGVAFERWRQYRRSPDLSKTTFVDPCDLVAGTIKNGKCTDTNAVDQENHGTWVASEIAETTDNRFGVAGLAYNTTIMPVRVLNNQGAGSATAVAAGIRYAVNNGAQVINLSLEFEGVTRGDIPGVIDALAYAHQKGVVVVGVAGNDSEGALDYPAAYPTVISVAATTFDRCLAVYSDWGRGLDLVAPGGGDDARLKQKGCHPNRSLPSVYQMTFENPNRPGDFSLPRGWYGTSMAAPAVSAAAAMVIASGVIGSDPTPAAVRDRLEATARRLHGDTTRSKYYGWGLLNIKAATSPGGPTTPG